MTIRMDLVVAAPNETGVVCPNDNCGKRMSRSSWGQQRSKASYWMLVCQHCGKQTETTFGIEDCWVDVESRSEKLLDDSTAKNARWFHVTTRENWVEEIATITEKGTFILHAGTREAATERAKDSIRVKGTAYYVHELVLDEDANLAPHILYDENNWPMYDSRHTEEWDEEIHAYDAARYINIWEAPGSVSILVKGTKVKVVRTTKHVR
jgi:hypothetical protein